jgi:poly-gamma-glutamate capsule biosynthesis protein CapA/YwtB (metallophosphatase superfamily)
MGRDGRIVLLLAGDVMTGRGIDQILMHPGDPELNDPLVRDARGYVHLAESVNGPIALGAAADYIWGDALAEMDGAGADLRIVNLETAITDDGVPWPAKGVRLRMSPANIDCLRAAHIDACALANNHALDWDRAGLTDTMKALRAAGVQFAGAGVDSNEAWAPARLPLPGRGQLMLFSFAAKSSGVPSGWSSGTRRAGIALLPDLSVATAGQLTDDIVSRRGPDDRVVVSIHWGDNWGLGVPLAHRDFAHRLIDSRAVDVVHGHSSHHPLPVEVYRGKLILYGCGDLINDHEGLAEHGSLRSDVGCLYVVTLRSGSGRLDTLEVVPMQTRQFRLGVADAAAQDWIGQVFASGESLGEQPVRHGAQRWRLRAPT